MGEFYYWLFQIQTRLMQNILNNIGLLTIFPGICRISHQVLLISWFHNQALSCQPRSLCISIRFILGCLVPDTAMEGQIG